MSQVNKYADKAGYTADKNRKDTQSAVSYVEDDGEVIYDGVNVVVDRDAADAGDLAVFDKTDGTLKFVKGATLLYDRLPPELVPMAVVYGRRGERVRIVALRHLDFYRWAVAYEVKLSGFDLAAGGNFTLTVDNTSSEFTYPRGATLASIAAQINADTTIAGYSWKATASDEIAAIVMECNTSAEKYKKISATGCTLTKHAEDVDYQTTAIIIPAGTYSRLRRRNGIDTNLPAASMMPFWSITARTAARVPTFRWAARRSSGKVSLPRPITRRCSRPIRPTGTTCSANILPNIRRLTKHFCRTAKTIRPFSPGKQRPTSMARLFRVIRRQPQLRPMGCRSRG